MTPVRPTRAELAESILAALLGVAGVARMSSGGTIEVATLHRGGKVPGVWLRPEVVEVHVVAEPVPLAPLAEEAHARIRSLLDAVGDQRPVRVVVDDIELDADPDAGVLRPPIRGAEPEESVPWRR